MNLIASIVNWLKSPKRWLAVLIVGAVLLLLPTTWLRSLSLLDLVTKYRTWIAGATLLSAAVLFAELLEVVFKDIRSRYRHRKGRQVSLDYLHNLTASEKGALRCYIVNDTETWHFDVGDGIAEGLVKKGLLYSGSSVGNLIWGFAYNMQPWVRHYLIAHPELLEGGKEPNPPGTRLRSPWM